MKRMHIHVRVENLSESIRFYAALFGAAPTVEKSDYAKWTIEDPRVNFAVSARGLAPGLDHLGVQVDEPGELAEIAGRLDEAGEHTFDEAGAACCYAQSDKSWVSDPAGLRWETFFTFGEATIYGADRSQAATPDSACCGAPGPKEGAACC